MKVLLVKTFAKMFKIIPVTIISLISGAIGLLFAFIYNQFTREMVTYERLVNNVINVYSLLAFMIIAGLMIWIVTANSATGLFASEIHEGTMRLLLSKEISRKELVVGKMLGMFCGSVVYLIMCFATMILMFCLFSKVEKDILGLIIQATFIFILYGIIVIFIIGSLASFLSVIFKKKVPAILIMVALAGIIFGLIPIIRVILLQLGYYERFNLYFVDLNYHFGLIFNNFLSLLGDFSVSQNSNGIFSMFTNLYIQQAVDVDIALANTSYYVVNNSLNGLVVMVSYLVVAIALYGASFRIMLKKDI